MTPDEMRCLESNLDRPFIVFDLRYAHYRRNYRKVYNVHWPEVLRHVEENLGFAVVRLTDGLSLSGIVPTTPNLRDTISWIRSSTFFVGVDSAPSHIAAALGKPALILFGAVTPWYRHLPEFYGIALQNPCLYAGCYHSVKRRSSQDPEAHCVMVGDVVGPPCCTFTTGQLIDAINQLAERCRDSSGKRAGTL